jgi:hypothetical protein
MQAKLTRLFTDCTAALLAALATMLAISNFAGAGLVQPHDPLFALSLRTLFWIVGGGSVAVMCGAIFLRSARFKLLLILWFTANLLVYGIVARWQGGHNLRGYLGSVAHTFDLSALLVNQLTCLLFVFLFIASAALLLWNWLAKPEAVPLKTICAHCGGHIAFSASNLGQKIPCPHCHKEITLRKSDRLKMTCFFCQEHIEFPPHAIGEKIPCPHCKMGITLKEPA